MTCLDLQLKAHPSQCCTLMLLPPPPPEMPVAELYQRSGGETPLQAGTKAPQQHALARSGRNKQSQRRYCRSAGSGSISPNYSSATTPNFSGHRSATIMAQSSDESLLYLCTKAPRLSHLLALKHGCRRALCDDSAIRYCLPGLA